MSGYSQPRFFHRVREQLRYWPYTIHQIDDTLDIGLIEGKARQLLYQALNARNLTAFVGSGVSAAYGRQSWWAWQNEHLAIVGRNATAFIVLAEASLGWIEVLQATVAHDAKDRGGALLALPASDDPTFGQARQHAFRRWLSNQKRAVDNAYHNVKRLNETFRNCRADGKGYVGGEVQPVLFEIARQLDDAVERYASLYFKDAVSTEEGQLKDPAWAGVNVHDNPGAVKEAADGMHQWLLDKGALKMDATGVQPEKFKRFLEKLKDFRMLMRRPFGRNSLEEQAKRLLATECAHALTVLRDGFLQGKSVDDTKGTLALEAYEAIEAHLVFPEIQDLERALPGIRDTPGKYKVLVPFKRANVVRTLNDLRGRVSTALHPVLDQIAELVKQPRTGNPDERSTTVLTPSLRFLLGALLCLHDDPAKVLGGIEAWEELTPNDFLSRRSILDARLDPIEKIASDLGVRRFITTNYDFEIERYFMDRGFHRFPRHEPTRPREKQPAPRNQDFRSDAIGGVLRDETFRREHASDLVTFPIGDARDEAAVFHLHGRATGDDSLVMTERDYMNLYLWEDGWRDTVNEGITMAFSSGPLLFLGLGMTEGEMLRPMRQFMSNRDRTVGYHAMALLPADKSLSDRTELASSLYLRYGVHTIFYGGGQIAVTPHNGGEKSARSLDWLHRIIQVIGVLKKHLGDVDKKLDTGVAAEPEKLLKNLVETLSEVSEDLPGYSELTDAQGNACRPSAFMALFGREMSSDTAMGQRGDLIAAGGPELQVCTFTPVRQSEDNEKSAHHDEDAFVDDAAYVGGPTALLDAILKHVLTRETSWTGPDRREVAALRLMLDGLYGAFLTGSMNAALDGMHRGWVSWWKRWQEAPPQRVAKFEKLPRWSVRADAGPVRYVRHPNDDTLGKIRDHWVTPVSDAPLLATQSPGSASVVSEGVRTGVRSFDTFCAAIGSNRNKSAKAQSGGRIMFTVLAHRGLGKGTFMSVFSSPRGLSLYEGMLWRNPKKAGLSGRREQAFLLSACFVGLAFSTEIGSVYDMLFDAILDATVALETYQSKHPSVLRAALHQQLDSNPAQWRETCNRAARPLRALPRSEALREIMRRFGQASEAYRNRGESRQRPRFLICLGALELLYDRDGRPKNPEIAGFIDWLTGPQMADLPFDLVFLGSESRIGVPFSKPRDLEDKTLPRVRLDRDGMTLAGEAYLSARLREGRVQPDRDFAVGSQEIRNLISGGPEEGGLKRSTVNFIHVVRPFNAVGLLLDNFRVLAMGMYLRENETDPSIKTAFENAVKQGQGDRRKKTEELWARQKLPEVEELRRENGRVWARIEAQNFGGMTGERYFQKKINEVLREANPDQREPWAENMHEYWRKTRHRLGENRFLMTLLLAAAERRMLAAASPLEGADDARRFITATVDLVRNDGADKREETVLRAVLESYAARHQIGDPEADFELHQLILRHLGVVGAPMAVDVMVRLPEFRDYFDRLSVPLPYSRRRFLARSLTDLTHRGLIFRLSPHPRLMELEAKTHGDSSDWPVTEKHRFALHRIVQRHALTRLGIGTNDAVAVGSFAPTLSAAIPSPGTGLSEEGYGFVRSLMIGLSQYPDIPQDDDRLRPWLFTTKDANIRIQALRASLTLARSTISLPVFAAFNAYETDGPGLPKRGFLDTYKVRLRWIIRHAWESVHREKNQPQTGSAPTAAPTNSATLNALYRDETVWLYNELGVVALAQGNLTEALGFLRLAREFNEEIEGHARRGPIFDRIALNYAVVQLERGRLFSAERSLDQVLKSPHADATLHNLADGYCALLDHIRGRNEGVDERFTRVTKDLEGRGELRGAALLKMHHAQLIAEIDPLRGLELSNRAHDLAEIGSQEDIRQRAELVRIMLEYRTSNIGNSDEMRWSQRALDVENYGRRMGSWSLQVDALRLRAEHMLAFGETALAGQLLVRAMAISRRNRMMLRLNGTMTQYARALMLRRDRLSALAVATKSLALAKSIQYGLEEARTTQLVMQIESGLDAGAITTAQLPI